ncbi:MAG: rRNA maturation RNase YbeY [Deltaproteobacteria bacterium]
MIPYIARQVMSWFAAIPIPHSASCYNSPLMKIQILDKYGYADALRKRALRTQIRLILKRLGLPAKTELSLTFVGDGEIRALNRDYRAIDRATDVLSFGQYEPEGIKGGALIAAIAILIDEDASDALALGDIVISIDTAARHAVKYGNTLDGEILKLIIHAALHLLGYDHKTKTDAEAMRAKEREIGGGC